MLKSLHFPSTNPTTNFSVTTTSSFRCRAAVAPPPPRHAPPSSRKLSSGSNSLYEVLRVKPSASIVEIKSAYRSLAKLYHPDASQSQSQSQTQSSSSSSSEGCDFMEIHNAYETLCDPAARAVYDMSLGFGSNYRFTVSGRRRPTRRWETDQCW